VHVHLGTLERAIVNHWTNILYSRNWRLTHKDIN